MSQAPAVSSAPHPDVARRFYARSQMDLNPVDPLRRAKANAAALTAVLACRREGRQATVAEQATIAKFSGWGACPHLFDDDPDWDAIRAVLHPLLDEIDPTAWESASAATLNSHYTDADIAASTWELLRGLGLSNHEDGSPIRIWEPGVGSGIFMSTAPRNLHAEWYGVDVDPCAVAVARALHPDATIDLLGLEQVAAPDDTFDLVIGNVPFGDYKLLDPRHNKHGWTVHHHATFKAVALTRPGGLIALLNSHWLLDSKTTVVRAAIDELADLVCVVRFPNGTFQRSAGTDVVEDLMVFRRRPVGVLPAAEQALLDGVELPESWIDTVEQSDGARNAKYRVNAAMRNLTAVEGDRLPFMVALGFQHTARGAHSRGDFAVSLTPIEGMTIRARAIELFQGAVGEAVRRARQAGVLYVPPDPFDVASDDGWDLRWREELDSRKEGSIHQTETGGLVRIVGGRSQPYKAPKSGDTAELKALVDLRDATMACLSAMVYNEPKKVKAAQQTLGLLYDSYVEQFGFLNRYREQTRMEKDEDGEPTLVTKRFRPTMGGFRNDPDFWSVIALEAWDEATRTARKAPVFFENVVGVPQAPNPTTVGEAIAVSLDQTSGVDVALIAGLLDRTVDDIETELRAGQLAYEDPATGMWAAAATYLAGDVRTKIDVASAAAVVAPERFARNIAPLQEVCPADLGPEEIDLRLGSPMIDTADVEQFAMDILGTRPHVTHLAAMAKWEVNDSGCPKGLVTQIATWGTRRLIATRLLDLALNLRPAQVFDKVIGPDGKDRKVLNAADTEAARHKMEEMADRFSDWLWEDPERTAKYVDRYNRKANCWAAPRFDGSHLTLPGLTPSWHMRPHQKDAIWRVIAEGGGVLAHSVGLGKSAIMISSAVEMRRLGIAAKPMIVIPNHMLEQIAREARQLYPAARMLVCSAEDGSKDGRRAFIARCATGNWDFVVMTHSAFGRVPLSAKQQAKYLARRISVLRRAMSEAGRGATVKEIEKAIKRLEAKVRAAIESGRDLEGMTFEDLGVDHLMIDEAHLFKNLDTGTSVTGLQGGHSNRAEHLAGKIDWLTDRYGDFSHRGPNPTPGLRRRRAVLSTGTPVANSIAELWVMARFADYPALTAAGYEVFDAWFGAFGQTVARLEVTPDGGGFRVKDRPARFRNVPELLALWLQVADVRSLRTVSGIDVPEIVGGGRRTVTVEGSSGHQRFVAELMIRAENISNGSPDQRPVIRWPKNLETGKAERKLTEADDNILWVVTDGRKAAMHLPLVGGNPDPAGGKIRACATEVARIFEETKTCGYGTEVAGSLQLVFCDMGVNPRDRCPECDYPLGHGDVSCQTCQAAEHERGRSVYELLRIECARLGVPYGRVRFMGEARNDGEKAALFAACRDGLVSVLVGSTERMGVGTNVQTRCVALHHLDAPWRPCDIEQREGRIVRQGNLNPKIEVLVYVTSGTFDSYMWQTLETKAGFIDQVTSGQITARTIDDVGETSMGFAEVKAAAAGNPIILEHARASMELKAARSRSASHLRRATEIRNIISYLTQEREQVGEVMRTAKFDARAMEQRDGVIDLTIEKPPASGMLTTLDMQQRMVGWVTWWRGERDDKGMSWRRKTTIGTVGPWRIELSPDREDYGPDDIDIALPMLVVRTALTKRVRMGRRDVKLPDHVNWEAVIRTEIGDPRETVRDAAAKIEQLDKEIAAAKIQLAAPYPGQTALEEIAERVARLDGEMRQMADVQASDPNRYLPNPDDPTDWDALEDELSSMETEALVAEMAQLDEPDDGWVDFDFPVTDEGQGYLFSEIGAPKQRRRRR